MCSDLFIYIFFIRFFGTFSQFLCFGIESIFVIRFCASGGLLSKNGFLAPVGCDSPRENQIQRSFE